MDSATTSLTIGALGEACGVPTPTIRYYEKIGLMPPAARSRADQRRYGTEDVARLTFIRRCRAFGFSTAQTRTLLAVPDGTARECSASQTIARTRIADIRHQITDLLALEKSLNALITSCEATCGTKPDQTCGAYLDMTLTGPVNQTDRQ